MPILPSQYIVDSDEREVFEQEEALKKEIIESLVSLLPQSDVLASYARIFLGTMSSRTLRMYRLPQLAEFVQERFVHFQSNVAAGGRCKIHRPKEKFVWLQNRWVLDLAYPDASFIFFTIENLFRRLDIRVTRQLHPIFSVELDAKGQIIRIAEPNPNSKNFSSIYLEFYEFEDKISKEELGNKIAMHMAAVQHYANAQSAIAQKIASVKTDIADVASVESLLKDEWIHLLDWLNSDNFVFIGYLAYRGFGSQKTPIPDLNSGLGVLESTYLKLDKDRILESLTEQVVKKKDQQYQFFFDTINANSPVQRYEKLMRLSLKIPNKNGEIVEHNFLGLLRRSSLHVKNSETPLIHLKMEHIFTAKKMLPGSHDYNEVIRIFTGIPKYELFRSSEQTLLEMVENLLSITNPNNIYCFGKLKPAFNTFHLVIVVPPQLFTRSKLRQICQYLEAVIPHKAVEFTEILDPDKCRLHVYFELTSLQIPGVEEIEDHLRAMLKPWDEQVLELLYAQFDQERSGNAYVTELYTHYVRFLPEYYRVRTAPEDAIRDVVFLDKVGKTGRVQFNVVPFENSASSYTGKVSLLYIYYNDKIDLIDIMPILENMGLLVIDQLTTRLGEPANSAGYIQSYRVTDLKGQQLDEATLLPLLSDMFTRVFEKRAINDPLNRLAILAHLSVDNIHVIRAYRNFYLQLRAPYSREKINATLINYPNVTRILCDYFHAKFSPDTQFGTVDDRSKKHLPHIHAQFIDSLQAVDEMADDTIFRQLFNVIDSSLRTNFYQEHRGSGSAISFKVDSTKITQMPSPTPYREIYVHDVGVEGVHLRFGPVSRGGLRWSSREDDFRTEILGLVKTQQTKNVVIVPQGSKGGFFIKQRQSGQPTTPQELEVHYRIFVSALLDITDNVDKSGKTISPKQTICYDAADPYLVVAADKGTAHLSDVANDVSEKYGFWLGDAFASGGSHGYDHKKEGITARGGWECVKLHFLEMGKDIQTESFSAVGVGDMAGDVFGNGMLLSALIQLKAAFNHIHIFLDPNPDPKKSYDERRRLFQKPRSTWEDYNAELISQGGGVFLRKSKEIHLHPDIKKVLGITEDVVNGEQLVKAILAAPVDLIWFGGIGTYVRSEHENNAQVGDPSNDGSRITSQMLRAKVIGEGANLAMTQLARIEFDQLGGHINTDALDNSAGVNMSDYEVNLKILAEKLRLSGHISSIQDSQEMLAAATDEVAELVLANNLAQHRMISMDRIRSQKSFKPFMQLVEFLVEHAGLDTDGEVIPSQIKLQEMSAASQLLPRPVLSKLQAYAKMHVRHAITGSALLSDPFLESVYLNYIPESIRKRFSKQDLLNHQLRSEIISMSITNKVINQAGCACYFQLHHATGRSVEDITRAYLIADAIVNADSKREEVLDDPKISQAEKYVQLMEIEALIVKITTTLLMDTKKSLAFGEISAYQGDFSPLIQDWVRKSAI